MKNFQEKRESGEEKGRGKVKESKPRGIFRVEGICVPGNIYVPESRTNSHDDDVLLFFSHHSRAPFHEHETIEQFVITFVLPSIPTLAIQASSIRKLETGRNLANKKMTIERTSTINMERRMGQRANRDPKQGKNEKKQKKNKKKRGRNEAEASTNQMPMERHPTASNSFQLSATVV